MTVESRNKDLVQLACDEVTGRGNLELVPQLYAKDFVRRSLMVEPGPYADSESHGLGAFMTQLTQFREAFPDWDEQTKLIIAEQNLVTTWSTGSGVNTGGYMGNPSTGKKAEINIMSFYRIEDNTITEQWLLPDLFSMKSQLELIPRTAASDVAINSVIQVHNDENEMKCANVVRNRDLAMLANEKVWSRGDFEDLGEMFSDDFAQHLLPLGTTVRGLNAFEESCRSHREAFPDWTEDVKLIVAEGDIVAIQYTSTGENTGSFLNNPPTGKSIQINEMTIFQIREDRIVEQWLLPDILTLYQQLGFIS